MQVWEHGLTGAGCGFGWEEQEDYTVSVVLSNKTGVDQACRVSWRLSNLSNICFFILPSFSALQGFLKVPQGNFSVHRFCIFYREVRQERQPGFKNFALLASFAV